MSRISAFRFQQAPDVSPLDSAINFTRNPLRIEDGIPVFSHPSVYTENYKKIATDYLREIDSTGEHPWIPPELLIELDDSTRALVTQYARDGDAVLDLGVGLGRILEPLSHLRRFGIDISMQYLRRIRASGFSVAYCRIEDLPYTDNSFDLLVAVDVLEHVVDLLDASKKALAVLKPGGVWIVRVPYREDLTPYLAQDLPYEFVHLRNFDVPSLKMHFCKLLGCEWIESTEVGHHYQGPSRLRLRALSDPAALTRALDEVVAVDAQEQSFIDRIRPATTVAESEIAAWIYEAREYHPKIFALCAKQLVMPIEINIVVRKPMTAIPDPNQPL
jgi:SAM-dependent methyltransferase